MANMCSPARSAYGGPSNPVERQYLETYEVDKRSVFVGNLPVDIQELDLQQKFQKYGPIRNITLHKNESVVDGTIIPSFPLNTSLTFRSWSKALLRLR